MARKARKPSRAERRRLHFQWQLESAPSERDRLSVSCQYLRAVLANAADPGEAERVAGRMARQLQEAAGLVRTKEKR